MGKGRQRSTWSLGGVPVTTILLVVGALAGVGYLLAPGDEADEGPLTLGDVLFSDATVSDYAAEQFDGAVESATTSSKGAVLSAAATAYGTAASWYAWAVGSE